VTDRPRYILRDLPGVAELEHRLRQIDADPSGAWSKLRDGLDRDVDLLSRRHFGITQAETQYQFAYSLPYEENATAQARWEEHFYCLDGWRDEDEAAMLLILDAMGWDVTDGAGRVIDSLRYFGRQIVCAAKGLKGRLPDTAPDETELAANTHVWARQLAAEAAKFQERRRGARR
jgi:hypothetical protein